MLTSWTITKEQIVMKNPPHPGGVLRRQVVEALGLTVTEAARALRVSRPAISNLLNERVALSPEMAIRFEKAFGIDMETILGLQHAHDVAAARKGASTIEVRRYRKAGGRRRRAA
jgi:addiction module HigA family antidote